MPKDGGHDSVRSDWSKASPEEAYAEAQRLIAQAAQDGSIKLVLKNLNTLKALPNEIGSLAKLESLELLNLDVSDLSPLRGLINLRDLEIIRVPVDDVSALGDLGRLRTLWLSQIPVADIRPLSRLAALEVLWLEYTFAVTDLSPLASLKNLKKLKLRFCPDVEDITALSGLHALERLELPNTKVCDIGPLSDLKSLTWLDLDRTKVADVTPLGGLKALAMVDLQLTQVADAAPLAKLTALEWLRLRGTNISDLRPLALLTNLHWLDVENTKVDDLGPLVELVKLIAPAGGDEEEDEDPYEEDPDQEYFRPHGLHYGGTPVAGIMPYYTFVQLGVVQRTLQTVNHLRDLKGLPLVYPEGYYQPQRPDPDSDERMKILRERVKRAEEELSAARVELTKALGNRREPHAFRRIVLVVTLCSGLLGTFAYLLTIDEKCRDRGYLDCAKQNTIIRWIRETVLSQRTGQ